MTTRSRHSYRRCRGVPPPIGSCDHHVKGSFRSGYHEKNKMASNFYFSGSDKKHKSTRCFCRPGGVILLTWPSVTNYYGAEVSRSAQHCFANMTQCVRRHKWNSSWPGRSRGVHGCSNARLDNFAHEVQWSDQATIHNGISPSLCPGDATAALTTERLRRK